MKLGNVLILGDSYSTYEGYIPEGNAFWYGVCEKNTTDVTSVTQTWWHMLLAGADATLVLNESYSGSTVCNTERPEIPGTSFVRRLDALIERGFFSQCRIDTVFVFGGTNDAWIHSPIGENHYRGARGAELDFVLPAFCYLLERLVAVLPQARIVAVFNCDIKEEILQGFADAAREFGVEALQLQGVSKQNGHPDVKGMREIKEQLAEFLQKTKQMP